ncbi:MAG TPA: CBS domain-containing protein [Spongiibacteraceae bacterium]|jgi:acetoin utilization protein AcuB|nr:CBS domain-containing protein [Spongiibacteraceae bacterium]HUH36842.1 CBS domain-containing protein [Spongiibacteraceae bacterium]
MHHIPPLVAVMTPFPYHIEAGQPLSEAAALMRRHAIRHLPVLDQGDIIGVISERDLQRATIPGHPLSSDTELMVQDLCTQRPYVADVSDPLDRILEVMADKRLGSVLVLKDGELAGIFTAVDACALLAAELQRQFRPDGGGRAA